ncbi:NAD(P)-dependent oxidoreductase (plasmid) [Paroceanicella profunda]|uniref:NAD(P)-dependent oxidoreductase n=1 Tax=Paroceanicella profunda TaxID=2579971 RepID=A0A5B8G4V9_9RHOB|nr:NAD(P)-dependent oxidoreductase [Paroceanicella profunda]QDL94489.1 NAD(P)-dependent oxidoreductase [Paroceanicella profunda]
MTGSANPSSPAPRRVAITGGAGFIGLAAAEALLAGGHAVRALDLAAPPAAFLAHPALAGLDVQPCDTTDGEALCAALRAFGADALIHLAAMTPDAETARSRAGQVVAVNVGGTVAAVEAAARAGVSRVLMLSSVAVYGGSGPWSGATLTEDTALRPDSLYGVTKQAAEGLALHLGAARGLTLTVLRLGPVFGPWERPGALRPDLSPHGRLLELLAEGAPAVLPHEMRGDWLYSRDAGRGIALALGAPGGGSRVFNLGAGRLSTPSDWAGAAGLPRPDIDPARATVAARVRPGRPMLDISALRAFCGHAGGRPLADAAADHMAWRADILPAARTHP